ncbi:hypothetical protein R6Q59_009832 [Mikania micrantha]
MNGWGWFFLIVFLLVLAFVAWVAWRFFLAKRQGLPPPPLRAYIPFMKTNTSTNYPTPRASGPLDWIKDKIASLRNKRTARGAYEDAGPAAQGNVTGRRGRGLEDDAWDARVGNEDPYGRGGAYYHEEQELGLAPTPGYTNEQYGRATGDYLSHANSGYAGVGERGRSGDHLDPFGDEHQAPSLRSVSPRPEEQVIAPQKRIDSLDSNASSPTSVRKSVFREGI